ncbi:MAG: hypothetical protein IMF07_07120, partial [Proteobacteria bacterium]|nr:hypothetical protein [Pseudomonadota bacterium]
LWRSDDNGLTWGTDPVATIADPAATTTSDNPPGSLSGFDYKYYLIAVDSCPLDSGPSAEAGPY